MQQSTVGNRSGFHSRIDSFFQQGTSLSMRCHIRKYIILSRIFIDVHEFDSARIFIDSALQLQEDEGSNNESRRTFLELMSMKGEILYGQERYNDAFNYYFNAKLLADKLNDTCIAHNNDYILAIICYRQQKYHDAIFNFRGTIWHQNYCVNLSEFSMQENLDNIGLCYAQLGLNDSALLHYDSAIAVIERARNVVLPITYNKALAVVYGNKGTLLQRMGETDSAISLLGKSYALNIQPEHENNDALITHQKLAALWLMKDDRNKAADALLRIRAELDTIYHTDKEEAEWMRLSAMLEDKNGNYDLASKYYRRYIVLKDSLNERQKQVIASDITRELDQKESQYQMQLLEKQNRLNNAYLVVAIVFLTMVVVIALLIYRNYRRSRQNVRVLTNLNDRIVSQKGLLEEKNREKDHILHVVAHDLRNPISGIMALSRKLIKQDESGLSTRQLQMIEKTSENALELIEELLELNARDKELPKELYDINELVTQTVTLLQPMALAKQQNLTAILPTETLVLPLHAGKMQRLLNNLVSNAIKFTPRHGSITVEVSLQGENVQIDVTDNGVGIPPEMLPTIFDAFTNARRAGTDGEKPIGLGLSICRQIAVIHDGGISVVSKQGFGSTFTVVLPAVSDKLA